VMFSLFTDFKNFSEFTPDARHEPELNTMLQQLVAWGEAMKTVREQAAKRAA
jgi:hypothetical protein